MHIYMYIYINILAHSSPAMHVAPKIFVTAAWTVYEDTLGTFSLDSLL